MRDNAAPLQKTQNRNRFARARLACAVSTLLALVLGSPGAARALTARALVDRTQIRVDETVHLTVVVGEGDGEIDTAAIEDFDVAYRGRSSSVRIVNTKVTREVHHQYVLRPRRAGTLIIPSLEVTSRGSSALTDPITVRVLEAGALAEGTSDLEVRAAVSTPSAYIGQEIVYTFSLRAAVDVARASYQEPSYEGFTVNKLDQQKSYTTVENGREVRVTELSYLLIPQKVGALTVGPAVLTCQVPDLRRRRRPRTFGSIFDDPFFDRTPLVERTLRTEPVTVRVSALPPPPADAPFTGLIGAFALSAEVDPVRLSVGDSATVTLTLEGSGNIEETDSPILEPPTSFKVYPDDPEEEVIRDVSGTRGVKRFRYALVPTEQGSYTLGPFSLATFDPSQGKYVVLNAGPLNLTVRPGEEPISVVTRIPSPESEDIAGFVRKRAVERTGHDILSVRQDLGALVSQERMNLLGFALWLFLPALLCSATWLVTRRRQIPLTASEQMARRAESLLTRSRKTAGDAGAGEFAGLLHRALISAVLARAGRIGESLTYAEVREILRNSLLGDEAASATIALLQRLDAARYGGSPPDEAARGRLHREVSTQVRNLIRGKSG